MRLKALILDDELSGRQVLRRLVEINCPDVEVVALASSIAQAKLMIDENRPDILFLDLKLGNDFGLDIETFLPEPAPHIIVTTAYAEFAIKAIKANAIDYLLKPIVNEELKKAIEKIKDFRNSKNTIGIVPEKRITVPASDGLVFVNTQDVIHCEASGAYTVIHLKTKEKLVISANLGEVEAMLPERLGFFRAHHSSLINVSEVVRYVKNDGGYVVLSDKTSVTVAQRKKRRFLDFMRYAS